MCRRRKNLTKRLAWAAAILLLGTLGACSQVPDKPVNTRMAQARELLQQGRQAFQKGDASVAAKHFAAALRLDTSIENHAGVAIDRLDLAQALDAAGNADAARQQLHELLADPQLVLDIEQRARAHASLARIALRRGDLGDTAKHVDAADLACGQTCSSAIAIMNLRARVALGQGDNPAALKFAHAALKQLETSGQESERANAFRTIGLANLAQGAAADAIEPLQQALALDRQLGLPERIADDLRQLARAYAATGNAAEASSYERRALAVTKAVGGAKVQAIQQKADGERYAP